MADNPEKSLNNTDENQPENAFVSTLSLDDEFTKHIDLPLSDEAPIIPTDDCEKILHGTSFRRLYKLFRQGHMSVLESAFNALYLGCHNRYEKSATTVKDAYKSLHTHPISWSRDKNKTHKSNIWSVGMRFLDGVSKVITGPVRALAGMGKSIGALFNKIPHFLDNSLHGAKVFSRMASVFALPLVAVALVIATVTVIRVDLNKTYALDVYIDGEYVGCTKSAAQILTVKHSLESDLSARYSTPIVLQCNITLRPAYYDEAAVIHEGDTGIFSAYLDKRTASGYGLYVDNTLAAVTDVRKYAEDAVSDYKSLLKQNYMRFHHTDVPTTFSIDERITIRHDMYPKYYFVSEEELRSIFGLQADNGEFAYSTDLDYAEVQNTEKADALGETPSAKLSLNVKVVREEYVTEDIPFETETIEDDKLFAGVRRMENPGSVGKKTVVYSVAYSEDRIVNREIVSESIETLPVNRVVRVGTADAGTLMATLPTGQYIFPYNGEISSIFGWRVLNGRNDFHQGLDIRGPKGEPIVASDGGEVIETGYTNGYGNYVLIRHNEDFVTRYAHCQDILTHTGEFVSQGQPIATLGETGYATGVHVHFEVIKDGVTVDPQNYLTGTLPYNMN